MYDKQQVRENCGPTGDLDGSCESSAGTVEHVGRWARRLKDPSSSIERAFAEQWIKEHERASLLAGLLCASTTRPVDPFSIFTPRDRDEVTQEEATAAATVIQWLGSNVGFSFLQEALRRCGYRIVKREGFNA